MGVDLFDNDEKIVINSSSQGLKLKEFTRKRFLDNLDFTLSISEDDMIINLIEGLKSKVLLITDEEWNDLILTLPFQLFYDDETNVDEVPDDLDS